MDKGVAAQKKRGRYSFDCKVSAPAGALTNAERSDLAEYAKSLVVRAGSYEGAAGALATRCRGRGLVKVGECYSIDLPDYGRGVSVIVLVKEEHK